MHAALVEVSVAGVDREDGIAGLRNHLVPAISSMPGFISGTWLTGGADDTGLSLTLWTTTQDAQRFTEQFAVGVNPQGGAEVLRSEVREIAATA
jgi:heme-degrading monooxygenase HmoA